jgi:hypothetical protein
MLTGVVCLYKYQLGRNQMPMHSLDEQLKAISQAIHRQVEIDRHLRAHGVKDLVGDYGEILAHKVLGGARTPPTTEGHDIDHPTYGRVQVKTRKYELQRDGKIRKEDRAVGFKLDKSDQFDWLCHIVLDVDYSVVGAVLVAHQCAWPEITGKSMKIKYARSCSLPSSLDITSKVKAAAVVTTGAA